MLEDFFCLVLVFFLACRSLPSDYLPTCSTSSVCGWNPAGTSRLPLRNSLLRTFTTGRTGGQAHGCLLSFVERWLLGQPAPAFVHSLLCEDTPAGPTWWVCHGLIGKLIKVLEIGGKTEQVTEPTMSHVQADQPNLLAAYCSLSWL